MRAQRCATHAQIYTLFCVTGGQLCCPPLLSTGGAHDQHKKLTASFTAFSATLRGMPYYTSQFTINTADNVGENAATNTWHCEAATVTDAIAFNVEVANFYGAIDVQMGNLIKTTSGLTWKTYNKADPEPRVPVAIGTGNLVPALEDCLPTEVSLCVSFQSVALSGTPQARRRGRIYLPFLASSKNGSDARPTPTLVGAVVTAADALVTTSKAATNWLWCVYSPTTGLSTEVDNGWVDNEWDTQRRRGRVRTSRSLFS